MTHHSTYALNLYKIAHMVLFRALTHMRVFILYRQRSIWKLIYCCFDFYAILCKFSAQHIKTIILLFLLFCLMITRLKWSKYAPLNSRARIEFKCADKMCGLLSIPHKKKNDIFIEITLFLCVYQLQTLSGMKMKN